VGAYALATAWVAAATAIGAVARMQLPELVMLYLLGVVIAAARFGRGPSLLAATLSIVVFDFFFIPPKFTFIVSEDRHVLTFAIMLVVGLLTSGLTLRIRKQEQEARAGEQRIATLYQLSRDLTSAVDAVQAMRATARHAAEICAGAAAVLVSDGDGGLRTLARSGPELTLDPPERAAIAAALAPGPAHSRAGAGVDGAGVASNTRLAWVPLWSGAEIFGVLALAPGGSALVRAQRDLLDAFARLATLALERARLAKQAEAAAVRAQTEETRSSLLSTVSHDLRTPLAAITGAATTLRDQGAAVDGAQRAELLDAICEEADRLERLVRNLLDLTRLESGALEVRREWIPLEEIVGSALMRLEARLEGRPIRTDLPADLPLLSVDAVLVEQALVNLLENAAKYTPAGTSIEIGARAGAQAVSVDVADRGPGLPPGDEARIFDKFFRGRGAGAAGAGLGLAICRGVAHAHRGTLIALNRDGGGALFRLTLPIVGQPPATPPDLDAPLARAESTPP
jgi:two-component system sensor histidine kinase KdpD